MRGKGALLTNFLMGGQAPGFAVTVDLFDGGASKRKDPATGTMVTSNRNHSLSAGTMATDKSKTSPKESASRTHIFALSTLSVLFCDFVVIISVSFWSKAARMEPSELLPSILFKAITQVLWGTCSRCLV